MISLLFPSLKWRWQGIIFLVSSQFAMHFVMTAIQNISGVAVFFHISVQNLIWNIYPSAEIAMYSNLRRKIIPWIVLKYQSYTIVLHFDVISENDVRLMSSCKHGYIFTYSLSREFNIKHALLFLFQAGAAMTPRESDNMARLPYLQTWFRTKSAIVLHLSNGTLQVNLFHIFLSIT